MFEIEITILAQLDFEEAYLWYEEQRGGLGDDLNLCYDETLEILKRSPYYQIRIADVRSVQIRRFPYLVIFRILNNTVRVIGFIHGERDPSVWQERV